MSYPTRGGPSPYFRRIRLGEHEPRSSTKVFHRGDLSGLWVDVSFRLVLADADACTVPIPRWDPWRASLRRS